MNDADLPPDSCHDPVLAEPAKLPAIISRPSAALPPAPALTEALKSATDYAAASKSAATKRAYRADWMDFSAWCESVNAAALPAEPAVLASYLAQLADRGKKVSTIRRRLAAIAYAHRLEGLETPGSAEPVRVVLSGICRRIGTAVDRKAPATAAAIAAMIAAARKPAKRLSQAADFGDALELAAEKPDLRFLRDRALLLIGFAAALRRSELVALDVADLEFSERGLIVHIRVSKTDQERQGAEIAIPNGRKLKPVAALRAWLEAASITEGPVFRRIPKGGKRIVAARLTDQSVANIVKQYAKAAGFDAAAFSGHSLRCGFVTAALEQGTDLFKIMSTTRHRDIDTLRVYDRRAKLFSDCAGRNFL